LIHTFAPVLGSMGPNLDISLEQYGFYPAAGGRIDARIRPTDRLKPLALHDRGALRRTTARALISAIPSGVAERELKVAKRYFALEPDALEHRSVRPAVGPGNALMILFEFEHLTDVFTGFGERSISAEQVAERVCQEAKQFLNSSAAVGPYLADQLLLPIALAGGGEFSTTTPTEHSRSNAALIEKFLPVEFDFHDEGKGRWVVSAS